MKEEILKLADLVEEFNDIEDIRDQINCVAAITYRVKDTLKKLPVQKENYKSSLLKFLVKILKENYYKHEFSSVQIAFLKEIALCCDEAFITKAQYEQFRKKNSVIFS